MKMKRFTAMVSSAVMVFSLLAGLTIGTKAEAAVTSELPTTNGLYMTTCIVRNWNEELQKDELLTDTDQNGNTVLLDWDGSVARYNEQDRMPEFYQEGLTDGFGLSFSAVGEDMWFDYIEDGKITHVSLADLTFTDPTTNENVSSVSASEWNDDPRVIQLSCSELNRPFKVTYTKGTTNNAFIMMPSLFSGAYTSPTEVSLDTHIDRLGVYEKGTTVAYIHITDTNWPDLRASVDLKSFVIDLRYFDESKNTEIALNATEATKYLTIKPVSTKDASHLVYKLLMKNIPASDGWAHIEFGYKARSQYDKESDAWDSSFGVDIDFIQGTAPTPAKGTTDTVDGLTYKVTGKNAATVTKGANKASVTIPAKVSIDGASFNVTGIDKNAFKGCSKVKTLTVKSTTIKTVGAGALKALKKTAVAKVPKAKKKAYKKLFKKGGFKGKVK